MKWYNKHIGDYQTATAHLTMLEHGAYNMLLDHYYATERQLPKDPEALRHIFRVKTAAEMAAIQRILKEFFTANAEGWKHKKAEQELERARGISEKRAKAGRRGAMTTNRDRAANAEQLPIEHEKPKAASAAEASTVPTSANGSAALALATATEVQNQTHSPAAPDRGSAIAEKPGQQKRAQAKVIAKAALDYLNAKGGKKFRDGEATLKFGIDRVLYDNATLADLCAVVDYQLKRVADGKLDAMYVRPETVWNKTKFASYMGEIGATPPPAAAPQAPQLIKVFRLDDGGEEKLVTEAYVAAQVNHETFRYDEYAKKCYGMFRAFIERGGNTTLIIDFAGKARRTFKTNELQ